MNHTTTAHSFPASRKSRQVLLVEDEAPIRELVRLHLSLAGFDITEIGDGKRALELARATRFDLIVLDLMLPGIDGITLCRSLRSGGANERSPILMLTAKDTESDKVLGLESGADDYLTKPFGMRELVARVGAILRRSDRADTADTGTPSRHVQSRDVTLDIDKRDAIVRGQRIELTKQEFDLLHCSPRTRESFQPGGAAGKVWGGDRYVTDRTVDSVVSRLRRENRAGRPGSGVDSDGLGRRLQVCRCRVNSPIVVAGFLGNGHREDRAARLARRANGSSVPLDDGLGDRQPKAAASRFVCPSRIHFVETFEDVRKVLRGNARA
jgi:DNA-binding response OmpR family regulator